AHDRRCIFGNVDDDAVRLSEPGELVARWWNAIPSKFQDVETDSFVIMPNHIHGVLWIIDQRDWREDINVAGTTLPRIMQWFKTMSANEFLRAAKRAQRQGGPLWQRSYWDRVIRNDQSLHDIRRYIDDNPRKWAEDEENPANRSRPNQPSRRP
ncbi:MAG: hypothetical protein EPO22_10115, partial [Dehalococcoidia bacterium]